jgi:hypothetical protein
LGVWYSEKRKEDGECCLEANVSDTVDNIISRYEKNRAKSTKQYIAPGMPGQRTEINIMVKNFTRLLSTGKLWETLCTWCANYCLKEAMPHTPKPQCRVMEGSSEIHRLPQRKERRVEIGLS